MIWVKTYPEDIQQRRRSQLKKKDQHNSNYIISPSFNPRASLRKTYLSKSAFLLFIFFYLNNFDLILSFAFLFRVFIHLVFLIPLPAVPLSFAILRYVILHQKQNLFTEQFYSTHSIIYSCCVFWPANWCSGCHSLVEINFLTLKQLFPSLTEQKKKKERKAA